MGPLKLALAIGVLALSTQLLAQRVVTHEAVSEPLPTDPPTLTDHVVFKRDLYERMTVPVMISGSGPYRFLVDTGADRTAISHSLANSLQLTDRRPARIHSITGEEAVTTARVPLLELGRTRLERIDAPMLDPRDMGADGILGVDALHSQRVLFDFVSKKLSIVPSAKRFFPDERGAIVVTGNARKGHIILTHARANGRRINVVIDTGAEVSVGNEALRRLLRMRSGEKSEAVTLMSVTGETLQAHYAFITDLDLQGVTLRRLQLVFADAHTFRNLELQDTPTLLLGMNAMRAFDKVAIDFAHKKVRFVPLEIGGFHGGRVAP